MLHEAGIIFTMLLLMMMWIIIVHYRARHLFTVTALLRIFEIEAASVAGSVGTELELNRFLAVDLLKRYQIYKTT